MGGFIDATNIIKPLLSIITSISLEHTTYLGCSTSEIAFNKAGIIKDKAPVLIGSIDEDAMYVIKERVKKTKSELFKVTDYFNEKIINSKIHFDCRGYRDICLNCSTLYQIKNACLAIDTCKILNGNFPVKEENVRNGLYANLLGCRFEFIKDYLLIDGAHNPEGITNLRKSLQNLNISTPIHVVFSCFTDKNLQGMLASIGEVVEEIVLTTFDNPRARGLEDYFLFAEDHKFVEDPIEAINEIKNKYPNDTILVTGSLAFAGYVKKLFDEGRI